MIVLTEVIDHHSPNFHSYTSAYTLALTADERTRSRLRYEAIEGEMLQLQLPRGTVLHNGDLLVTASKDKCVKVIAKPEPIITVKANSPLDLLRAAYHLGNRHVPLEVKPTYLRLAPDSVLEDMLKHLGLELVQETAPFQPESGAYGHSH
ncbi:urease accessory protein UreE [Synechococcus sp. PCC 7502]|uniref:urease accessory protein UreE n=1 Tax=Synechococcus sp. PCC 7502 TaxID=1173263 RepID=UPI00029FAEF4|nr:urease accessory protein UreE [Synechococcus sp. PCC 7502]AFY74815.1 urease accessory protein UreE [Synechococcus sp. PCC 7502]